MDNKSAYNTYSLFDEKDKNILPYISFTYYDNNNYKIYKLDLPNSSLENKSTLNSLFFYKAFLNQRMNCGRFANDFNNKGYIICIKLNPEINENFYKLLGFKELTTANDAFLKRNIGFAYCKKKFLCITKSQFNEKKDEWDKLINEYDSETQYTAPEETIDENEHVNTNTNDANEPNDESNKKQGNQDLSTLKFQISGILEFLFRLVKWIFVNQEKFTQEHKDEDLSNLKHEIESDQSLMRNFKKLAFNDLLDMKDKERN